MFTIAVIALGIWGYSAYRGWNDAVIGHIPSIPKAKALLPWRCDLNIGSYCILVEYVSKKD
jgi:hypothetical protein